MTVTVHLITGEYIPHENIQQFNLGVDCLILRGVKAKERYEFERKKLVGFDVSLMPYTNVGVKRGGGKR